MGYTHSPEHAGLYFKKVVGDTTTYYPNVDNILEWGPKKIIRCLDKIVSDSSNDFYKKFSKSRKLNYELSYKITKEYADIHAPIWKGKYTISVRTGEEKDTIEKVLSKQIDRKRDAADERETAIRGAAGFSTWLSISGLAGFSTYELTGSPTGGLAVWLVSAFFPAGLVAVWADEKLEEYLSNKNIRFSNKLKDRYGIVNVAVNPISSHILT
jgi:hypothetical protein